MNFFCSGLFLLLLLLQPLLQRHGFASALGLDHIIFIIVEPTSKIASGLELLFDFLRRHKVAFMLLIKRECISFVKSHSSSHSSIGKALVWVLYIYLIKIKIFKFLLLLHVCTKFRKVINLAWLHSSEAKVREIGTLLNFSHIRLTRVFISSLFLISFDWIPLLRGLAIFSFLLFNFLLLSNLWINYIHSIIQNILVSQQLFH